MKINNEKGRRYSVGDYQHSVKRGKIEIDLNENGLKMYKLKQNDIYGACMWSDGYILEDLTEPKIKKIVKIEKRNVNQSINLNDRADICTTVNKKILKKKLDDCINQDLMHSDEKIPFINTPYFLNKENGRDNNSINNLLASKKRVISKYKQRLQDKMKIIENEKLEFNDTIKIISEYLFERTFNDTTDLDIKYLKFLRKYVIMTNSLRTKNKNSKIFQEINMEAKRAADLLILYIKRKNITDLNFNSVFLDRDICNIIEQLNNEDTRILDAFTLMIKTIINKYPIYHGVIKDKCINILIFYIQGQRKEIGLLHIIELLHSFASKDLLSVDESLFIFKNCILPLVRNEIMETFTIENFIVICESFYADSCKFIECLINFLNKEFENGNTQTKIILIHLVRYILTKESQITKVLLTLIKISKSVFEKENYLIIEALSDIYIKEETFQLISNNLCTILPEIFDSIFELSKRFWYEKGKTSILVILQKFMRCDNTLFSECIQKYNKKKALRDIASDYDTEFADAFFNLLSVNDEVSRQRRKSVLPFESEKQVHVFRFEKKRHE